METENTSHILSIIKEAKMYAKQGIKKAVVGILAVSMVASVEQSAPLQPVRVEILPMQTVTAFCDNYPWSRL